MKAKTTVLLSLAAMLLSPQLFAQDYFAAQRQGWLQKAEECKPALNETVIKPMRIVTLRENPEAYQGWEAVPAGDVGQLYSISLKENSGIIVDFGEHLTGRFSCSLKLIKDLTSEAPIRLRLTFVEVPAELAVPYEPYPGGLSSAWIQQEVVTVDYVPDTFTIPRRLSFRYVRIEVTGHSFYDFGIADMEMAATTSAGAPPAPLPDNVPQIIRDIDRVGIATLKECMQTVYEDGPKRDRRLWIGDLYLEALANTYSFGNHELTKRCLYFLAGLAAENGFLHATVFETPEPHPQYGQHILDYALLWNTSLLDYLKTTGDMETALDLWPVAVRQTQVAKEYIGDDYLYNGKPIWIFSDWRDGYDPTTAMIGMMVKTFKDTYELGRMLGREADVADVLPYAQKLTKAARRHLYDSKTGVAYAGTGRQVSYLSQAWLALGGVLSGKEAQRALKTVMADSNAIYPGSPYGNHFLVEAMMLCGMEKEARDYLVGYWGGMVAKGADTFWEVYDPNNDTLSPYGFYPINSYCHAWSCTPVYFIRKYPEVFQK